MSAQLPAWAAVWRAIRGALGREREEERADRAETLRRGALLADLRSRPGWALFEEEVRRRIADTEAALLHEIPMATEGAPTPEWQMLQDVALRGQRQGYLVALSIVAEAVEAAKAIEAEERAKAEGSRTQGVETAEGAKEAQGT